MKDEEKIIKQEDGSALILAVVLVSLLAIVGVLFIMVARVDKISASSIAENRQLNHAVDTVIAKISQRLAWDVPRRISGPNDPKVVYEEYYDYPDPCNPWLANLEPYNDSGVYRWRHITDIYENLGVSAFGLDANVILDYQNTISPMLQADADGDGVADSLWIKLPDMTSSKGKPVFAAIRVIDNGGMLNVNTAYMFNPNGSREVIDGNSQIQINLAALSQRGSNGTPATAADKLQTWRCGTEPNDLSAYEQNVIWRYDRPNGAYIPFDISDELKLRNRYILNYNLMTSRIEVLWENAYDGGLEVPRTSQSQLQNDPNYWFWKANNCSPDVNEYDYRHVSTICNIDRVINPDGGKMVNVNKAAREPNANSINSIYKAVRTGLLDADPCLGSADSIAAQIAVNLVDFIDDDNDIVTDINDWSGVKHYGFERPCVYISELAQSFFDPCDEFLHTGDFNDPCLWSDPNIYKSYAIELYEPYSQDNDPCGWQLVIYDNSGGSRTTPIYWSGTDRFHILLFKNNSAPLPIDLNDVGPGGLTPADGATRVPQNVILLWPPAIPPITYDIFFGTDSNTVANANHSSPEFKGNQDFNNGGNIFDPPGLLDVNTAYFWKIDYLDANSTVIQTTGVLKFTVVNPVPQVVDPNNLRVVFLGGNIIELQRQVVRTGTFITVDMVTVPRADINNSDWLIPADPCDPNANFAGHSFQRDIGLHKPIRNLWDNLLTQGGNPTLGGYNSYPNPTRLDPDPNQIQAHPENKHFTNIGEIGMIFRKSAYYDNFPGVFTGVTEPEIRLNLADINYQQIFKYLTVFDPNVSNPDETRIKGRININTAPWYVLAQLPWVSQRKGGYNNALAREIVVYRDRVGGFKSIGELNRVVDLSSDPNAPINSINYYARDGNDLAGFPDLTPGNFVGDGAPDDFEERDVIFSRISNLVTVRSDVYTAYILVRIGANGPQKRVVAILDRSSVNSPVDKVKVIAVQQVPEAR